MSDKLSTNDNRAHNPNNSEDELNNEMLRLKAHLDLVEEGRLAGTPGISVEEARNRLMEKYRSHNARTFMGTPVAAGSLSLEELSAELQKGLDSIKKDRTYSADEVDAEIDAYINQDFLNSTTFQVFEK